MENQQPKFKHFIITLFNLKIWKEDKTHRATQTADWLAQRFDLFERFCLPSVAHQTNKDFTWLCLFDKDTPADMRQRIERCQAQVPQLKACFFTADEAVEFLSHEEAVNCRFIRRTVRTLLSEDDAFVITSNLDNDDALSNDYVERVQRQFVADQRHMLYSFVCGMQYFVRLNAIVRMHYPHNHFLTLVEDARGDFHTVQYYGHAGARKVLPNTDIAEKPYWLENVHGHNVSNELRITSRVRYAPCLAPVDLLQFGIDKQFSWALNLKNFLVTLPAYFVKIAIWRLKRKINKKKKQG